MAASPQAEFLHQLGLRLRPSSVNWLAISAQLASRMDADMVYRLTHFRDRIPEMVESIAKELAAGVPVDWAVESLYQSYPIR